MIFSNDYNNDFSKGLVAQHRTNQLANYLTTSYKEEILNKALVKFLSNSIKIAELEELGKKCLNLYMENRLILAVIKFYQTSFPCDDLDKPINCINHIGLERNVKQFNYFNGSALRLLENGSLRNLELTGNRALEGIFVEVEQDYVCTCKDAGTFYQTATGNYIPVVTTPINTEAYG